MVKKIKDNIIFAVGTGRCGTTFLYKVMNHESQVAAVHERNPLNETFHRFCKWYDLPLDHDGFIETKRNEIQKDLENKPFSFESSAYLSFSIIELFKEFNAKFILLIRRPDKVVNSYTRKGWYENQIFYSDYKKIPSYQNNDKFHHFLGRTLPKGSDFALWSRMSVVGKLAWFWNTLNLEVLKQFEHLPKANKRVVKLEELNFDMYQQLSSFIGFKTNHTANSFNQIVKKKPNAFNGLPEITQWSHKEITEFEKEVSEAAHVFDYPSKVQEIIELEEKLSTTKKMARKKFKLRLPFFNAKL